MTVTLTEQNTLRLKDMFHFSQMEVKNLHYLFCFCCAADYSVLSTYIEKRCGRICWSLWSDPQLEWVGFTPNGLHSSVNVLQTETHSCSWHHQRQHWNIPTTKHRSAANQWNISMVLQSCVCSFLLSKLTAAVQRTLQAHLSCCICVCVSWPLEWEFCFVCKLSNVLPLVFSRPPVCHL